MKSTYQDFCEAVTKQANELDDILNSKVPAIAIAACIECASNIAITNGQTERVAHKLIEVGNLLLEIKQ